MQKYIVLIETSRNQSYIFDTNKRRENVGASQLVYEAGRSWWIDPSRTALDDVEIVSAISGKVLLVVPSEERARELVQRTTLRALRDAPGLDVCGVVQEFDWEREELSQVSAQVHARFQSVRASRPGPEMRYLRLPPVADCRTSGLPASALVRDPDTEGEEPRSAASKAKLDAAKRAMERLAATIKVTRDAVEKTVEYLANKAERLGVIHADANALGSMFLRLGEIIQYDPAFAHENVAEGNKLYVQLSHAFSEAVERCTLWAFRQALDASRAKHVLPLVLGGDDVTVLCEGQYALRFAADFLSAFEGFVSKTHEDPADLQAAKDILLVTSHLPRQGLSACAGVAIVKRHFPFASAYDLVEALMESAKSVKRTVMSTKKRDDPVPCSALDFHVLHDASSADLRRIRRELHADAQSALVARPYVITPLRELGAATEESRSWVGRRQWDELKTRIGSVKGMPRSQLHALRAALFLGRDVAEARFQSLYSKYGMPMRDLGYMSDDAVSLFCDDTPTVADPLKKRYVTRVLDAMELVDVLGDESIAAWTNRRP